MDIIALRCDFPIYKSQECSVKYGAKRRYKTTRQIIRGNINATIEGFLLKQRLKTANFFKGYCRSMSIEIMSVFSRSSTFCMYITMSRCTFQLLCRTRHKRIFTTIWARWERFVLKKKTATSFCNTASYSFYKHHSLCLDLNRF
jgi:hypothetical protein